MKLYYSQGACSLGVRITLNEVGAEFESESVNLGTKKTESGKNFLEISPKGAVSTLVLDDGTVLTENAMILQYIADTYFDEKILPPVGDLKRYKVLEWVNYITTDMHTGSYGPLFNPNLSKEIKESVFVPKLIAKLDFVNKQLANSDYLAGNNFTIADAYLFVVLRWMGIASLKISTWSNLEKFFNRVKERPAVQKSLKEEGL
jgi:glutathione S-transferase